MSWSVLRIKFGPPPGNQAAPGLAQNGQREQDQGEQGQEQLGNRSEIDQGLPKRDKDASVSGAEKPPPSPDESVTDDSPPVPENDLDKARIKSTISNPHWATLGSIDPKSGYQMLATFSSRGAAVERVELSNPRYRDLQNHSGYLGNLALEAVQAPLGCRIGVVGPGTPAAEAQSSSSGVDVGLLVGDIIVSTLGETIDSPETLRLLLNKTKPGQEIELQVKRADRDLTFTTTLARKPMEVIYPEVPEDEFPASSSPGSFLLTLESIGSGSRAVSVPLGADEIPRLPSLRSSHWELVTATPEFVEYRFQIGESDMAKLDKQGALEIRKRYRLSPVKESDPGIAGAGYHLNLDVELVTLAGEPIQAAYRMDGPHGLPLEGWWYATKISPGWGGAGARDVVWRSGRGSYQLFSAPTLYKLAVEEKKEGNNWKPLFTDDDNEDLRTVRFLGVDTQYFSSILIPGDTAPEPARFRRGVAKAVEDVKGLDKSLNKTLDISFHVTSEPAILSMTQPTTQSFILFMGPREPGILERYQVSEIVEYGWWAYVSLVLGKVLSFFYWATGNFGISIIMLTIAVRTCMLPISFKMTKNAQRMQALAPEMKIISEKYKDNLEKKNRAIQELWKKHNVNPMSGCVLVFFQLPVFAGLYRLLATDITLRQSPLVAGMDWCSNLAGPDEFCAWPSFMPAFLVSETGWLGPFLNILPLLTIALFIMNQRLLTPPPTDDQQKMQQQIMTFMMIFFAVMFFKVPAGLCLYFIASSLWTLAEHKILKKNKLATAAK